MSLPHRSKLTVYSRRLRNNSTLAEVLLWQRINGKRLLGYKFRRQTSIGKYILDFFCYEFKLAIEIDGEIHYQKEAYDRKRLYELRAVGIHILQFGDRQVKRNLEGAVEEIKEWIRDHRRDSPLDGESAGAGKLPFLETRNCADSPLRGRGEECDDFNIYGQ